jgi:hypothetical protein
MTLNRHRLNGNLVQELWRRWIVRIWTGIDVSRCIVTTDRSDITKQRKLYDKSLCDSYAE